METSKKAPAFQVYPGDWQRDLALQSCSLAARGMWWELLCMMHDGDPRGYLRVNGRPLGDAEIAALVRAPLKVVRAALAELEDAGVPSRAEDGAIFSRRMVRDEVLRAKRAAGGSKGAEHGSKGAPHGVKGGRPKVDEETPLETPLHGGIPKPPPASASASASAEEPERGADAPPHGLDSVDSREAIAEYVAYRRSMRYPAIKEWPRWWSGLARDLEKAGHPVTAAAAAEAIRYSMAKTWRGVFPERMPTPSRNAGPSPSSRYRDFTPDATEPTP